VRVLVTGATGFVGRALCPALAAAGHGVTAAVRNPDSPAIPEGTTVQTIPDIGPETDWSPALSGMDAVVHLAARVHVMKEHAADPSAEFNRTNADGTARLAAAAADAGVRRFVYLSTIKVMGGGGDGETPFRETDTPRPDSPYGASKLAGEHALSKAAGGTGLEPVILRPPLVYGPGGKGNFLALLKLCRLAPPLPLASVNNLRSLIHVENLSSAIVRCLESDAAKGETYFVRDGEDISVPDLIRQLAQAMDRPARLFPFPPGMLKLAGMLTGKSDAVSRLLDSLRVDDKKIRRQLGWTPPINMLQGLKETAAWFSSGKKP